MVFSFNTPFFSDSSTTTTKHERENWEREREKREREKRERESWREESERASELVFF